MNIYILKYMEFDNFDKSKRLHTKIVRLSDDPFSKLMFEEGLKSKFLQIDDIILKTEDFVSLEKD